jgi:hypothetical protein
VRHHATGIGLQIAQGNDILGKLDGHGRTPEKGC